MRNNLVCASNGMPPMPSRKERATLSLLEALDEIAWDCGHVDGNKRAFLLFAVVMQRTRDVFFTGPRLSGDHDGEIGLRQARQGTMDFLHRGGAAYEMHTLEVRSGLRAGPIVWLAHGSPDDGNEFLRLPPCLMQLGTCGC